MNHSSMDHAHHNHMDHSKMDHSSMNHAAMDHGSMDHSTMDHSTMDHGTMDHSKMDHSKMGHGGMDMDMMMYFHVGVKETILFKGWVTTNVGELIGSCIVLFVAALLYEGLKVFREELLVRAQQELYQRNSPETLPTNDDTPDNGVGSDQVIIQSGPTTLNRILNKWHCLQSFLHIVQVTVSYMLMLVFMTYNVWLCLAVVLGAGTGYFCFGWRKQSTVDVNEHCH